MAALWRRGSCVLSSLGTRTGRHTKGSPGPGSFRMGSSLARGGRHAWCSTGRVCRYRLLGRGIDMASPLFRVWTRERVRVEGDNSRQWLAMSGWFFVPNWRETLGKFGWFLAKIDPWNDRFSQNDTSTARSEYETGTSEMRTDKEGSKAKTTRENG
ncbi:hypothetical protein FB451DRAFT_1190943 [Mycena latifolia]|nr:hypothetical protein FB451DRAFT_1190943 [Mycena latifolia]